MGDQVASGPSPGRGPHPTLCGTRWCDRRAAVTPASSGLVLHILLLPPGLGSSLPAEALAFTDVNPKGLTAHGFHLLGIQHSWRDARPSGTHPDEPLCNHD